MSFEDCLVFDFQVSSLEKGGLPRVWVVAFGHRIIVIVPLNLELSILLYDNTDYQLNKCEKEKETQL